MFRNLALTLASGVALVLAVSLVPASSASRTRSVHPLARATTAVQHLAARSGYIVASS